MQITESASSPRHLDEEIFFVRGDLVLYRAKRHWGQFHIE